MEEGWGEQRLRALDARGDWGRLNDRLGGLHSRKSGSLDILFELRTHKHVHTSCD